MLSDLAYKQKAMGLAALETRRPNVTILFLEFELAALYHSV